MVMVAKIMDNLPFCPECNHRLRDTTADVSLVIAEEKSYFEFHRRCDKCTKIHKYFIDTAFEKRYDLKGVRVIRIGREDD